MKKLLATIKNYFKEKNIEKIEKLEIKNVVIDSRKIEKDSLFFAINNGNSYIEEALNKGASLIIGDNVPENINDSRVLRVEDTIGTLQALANEYRKNLNLKIIGITGSNGKTTTKDLIHGVLSQKYRCQKTSGNYNNHIGVPYTILNFSENDEIGILEMGMSSFGEIDTLCKIAMPDYGVITNIGDSHLEFLKNRENVFKAKGEMIPYIDSDNLFLFGDDPFLKSVDGIKVGFEKDNNYQIGNISEKDCSAEFMVNNLTYEVPLNGRHNCINGAMAVAIGNKFEVSNEDIRKGLLKSSLSSMRFQRIEKENITYINDAYNASPISMKYSLESFNELKDTRKKIAVIGDMLELGENEIQYHLDILRLVDKLNIEEVYLFGPRMKEASKGIASEKIKVFEEKEDICKRLSEFKNITVLLKGSRGMRLEEIIR
ncbi:UDP-N-acetylmuramoyl-tripeptide--D-alanyl-D-alanine ligase [Cetobacterium sp. 2A]|uniref:UDP-N-acetylmuramoyl-tripeptide--D-alanyl-D- alanine ligase n=1 Tax=Cetobacterium sp. 2A TaxID=2754723 RepID=UPI001C8D57BA|nr:UDP-N-acetylmuramoyl-tripeptide--D-alanyl-D-alanine ligase [Cetobacterium sp. 2A]